MRLVYKNSIMEKLPSKLHKLLEIALDDLIKSEIDGDYISMRYTWYQTAGKSNVSV